MNKNKCPFVDADSIGEHKTCAAIFFKLNRGRVELGELQIRLDQTGVQVETMSTFNTYACSQRGQEDCKHVKTVKASGGRNEEH
jgi:hypothetical protein